MYVTMKKFLKVINADRYLTATALYLLVKIEKQKQHQIRKHFANLYKEDSSDLLAITIPQESKFRCIMPNISILFSSLPGHLELNQISSSIACA